MSVHVQQSSDGKELVIKVAGNFDFSIYKDFREAYQKGDQSTRYLIDLQGADYMDSAALGMLLVMRDFAGGDSANITLKNYSESLARILQIAHFDELFNLSGPVSAPA
jgi:anti-anti-sigma factor